jgi:hypothetical protein
MARPPKKAKDRKDVDLRIPVTREQKQRIVEAAELDQLDMAEWARSLLIKAANQRLSKRDAEDKK